MALAGAAPIVAALSLAGAHPLAAWLCAVNFVTLALYGYDKRIAGTLRTRVPEAVLHGLALAGGSPAALGAQRLFRHKTRKRSFVIAYWTIVGAQAALAVYALA